MNSTEIEVPAALQIAVRTTAGDVPPSVPDLGAVRTRAERIHRRRAALRASAAIVVIAALVAAYPAVRARVAPDVVEGGSVGPHPIGLWQNRDQPPVTSGVQSGVHVPGSDGEVGAQLRTVGGRTVVAAVKADEQPGLSELSYKGPAPLPGGGLATIGYAKSTNKNSFGPRMVVVVDAAGELVSSHPYPMNPTEGESRSMPMTGNSRTLFWWSFDSADRTPRPVLITYDIATGKLRELSPAVGGDGYLPYFGMQATDTRIISFPAVGGATCSADIEDATTGERVATLRPAIANCTDVYFALSPDNRRAAALVTYRHGPTWTQRVIVLDARTGHVQKEFKTPALATGTDRAKLVSGLDWMGNKTIRYARGVLGAGSDPILLTIRP
jgi:hypothetical protein